MPIRDQFSGHCGRDSSHPDKKPLSQLTTAYGRQSRVGGHCELRPWLISQRHWLLLLLEQMSVGISERVAKSSAPVTCFSKV